MEIVYFCEYQGSIPPGHESHDVSSVTSITDMLALQNSPDVVLMGDWSPEETHTLLHQLRSNELFHLTPIFSTTKLAATHSQLCDGYINNFDELKSKAIEILDSIEVIAGHIEQQDPNVNLLQFLFTRPNGKLIAMQNWQKPHVYHYPLAEIFISEEMDSIAWTESLYKRKLIEKTELLDRLRLCIYCQSPHLNYIERCPNCCGIDLKETLFIHCFTCGHVDIQEAFSKSHRFVCPRCNTQLRHIGTDYDRPMENYHCRGCHENFIEASVTANCLSCQKVNQTDELINQAIYHYQLSDFGRLAIRNNSVTEVYALLDELNYVHAEYFECLLDWQIKLAHRHQDVFFALFTIEINNVAEVSNKIGRYYAYQLMEAYAEQLRNIIRETDFTTRTAENRLWLLAPQTDSAGANKLAKRVLEIQQTIEPIQNESLHLKVVQIVSSDITLEDEEAKSLMAKLNMELDHGAD